MPWFLPSWSETIKKKVCRYLLQKCLGQFMEEPLNLDQLDIEIYNGTGTISDVTLSAQALNEVCESQGVCLEVVTGHIGALKVNIPWNKVMSEDSNVEITDLSLTIKPLARQTDGTSVLESVWSSMSSSMQLAQECMEKEEMLANDGQRFPQSQEKMEGLENFAQTIENVLNRTKAKLTNTEIRLEYIADDSDCGIALITKIDSLEYSNEASDDPPPDKMGQTTTTTPRDFRDHHDKSHQKSILLSTYSSHYIKMDGITFYTEEFRIVKHNKGTNKNSTTTLLDSGDLNINQLRNQMMISNNAQQYYSTFSNLSADLTQSTRHNLKRSESQRSEQSICTQSTDDTKKDDDDDDLTDHKQENVHSIEDDNDNDDDHDDNDDKDSDTDVEKDDDDDDDESDSGDSAINNKRYKVYNSERIIIGKLLNKQEIRIKLKQTEQHINGPNVQLDIQLGAIHLFSSPRQLHLVIKFSDLFLENTVNNSKSQQQHLKQQLRQQQQQHRQQQQQQQQQMDTIEFNKNFNQRFNSMSGGLGYNQGWSSEPTDGNLYQQHQQHQQQQQQQTKGSTKYNTGSGGGGAGVGCDLDSNFNYNYEQSEYGIMAASVMSTNNSSMTSSICSSASTQNTSRARRRGIIVNDPNADISSINIRIGSCNIILLHEDILLECASMNSSPLSEQSVKQLKELTTEYFRDIVNDSSASYASSASSASSPSKGKWCNKQHLKLKLNPIIIEGEEQRNENGNLLKLLISIPRAEFQEILQDQIISIVEFIRDDKTPYNLPKIPEILLKIKQTTHSMRNTGGGGSSSSSNKQQRFGPPKTQFNFTLAPCLTEIDISIIDRLNATINVSPFESTNSSSTNSPSSSPPSSSSSTPSSPLPGYTSSNSRENQHQHLQYQYHHYQEQQRQQQRQRQHQQEKQHQQHQQEKQHQIMKSSKCPDPIIDCILETPYLDVRFRFPIADSRPIHNTERLPWWCRNVRPDFLFINLNTFKMVYGQVPQQRFEVSCNEINVYYCESMKSSEKIHIGKATAYENCDVRYGPNFIEYPRITIDLPSDKDLEMQCNLNASTDESSDSDRPTTGKPTDNFGIKFMKKMESTPFSSKRTCRESDTPHSKQQQQQNDSFGNFGHNSTGANSSGGSGSGGGAETLIMPGDKYEMNKFCEDTISTSKIQISLVIPVASFQIKSKHLYETLYNRINTDLLLWEPMAPNRHRLRSKQSTTTATAASATSSKIHSIPKQIGVNLLNVGMMESIYVNCNSNIQFDSSSTNNSDSETDNFCSTSYRMQTRSSNFGTTGQQLNHPQQPPTSINAISFQLKVREGLMTMYAPVRDTQNHVIPGQLGEFVMKINMAVLFSVSGYHGNSNLNYLCLQANNVELHHCGMIPLPSTKPPPLRLINCLLPEHVWPTLYGTPKTLTPNESKQRTMLLQIAKREMLSLAVQIKVCPEQEVKRIRVAIGVQQATLRHKFCVTEHMWLTQLLDMFDVVDYPVEGYKPLNVVTELHLHLWDCAIDYRPLYLPIRTVITFGTFMISSNITTTSSGCTLRFIAEECTLCAAPQTLTISNPNPNAAQSAQSADAAQIASIKNQSSKSHHNNNNNNSNKITVLPGTELVCLIDLGLFEISLRMNEKPTSYFPKFDLRTSINDVHIRTCSDSAAALSSLITYIANEGDMRPSSNTNNNRKDDATCYYNDDVGMTTDCDEESICSDLLSTTSKKSNIHNIPEITETQQQRVNSLMEEAMQESVAIGTAAGTAEHHNSHGYSKSIHSPTMTTTTSIQDGVDIFFFPDEAITNKNDDAQQQQQQQFWSQSSDDEICDIKPDSDSTIPTVTTTTSATTTTTTTTLRRSRSLNESTEFKIPKLHHPDQLHRHSHSASLINKISSDIDDDNNDEADDDDDDADDTNDDKIQIDMINDVNLNCAFKDKKNESIKNVNFNRQSSSDNNMMNIDDIEPSMPQVTLDLGDVTKNRSQQQHGKVSQQQKQKQQQYRRIVTSTTAKTGTGTIKKKTNSDTDDDFCIIANEEKVIFSQMTDNDDDAGKIGGTGTTTIPITHDPIRIVDNHFSVPIGKDILLTPVNFPMVITRYTLCEMTLTWHLFGGHDFPTEDEKQRLMMMKSKGTNKNNHVNIIVPQKYVPGRTTTSLMSDAYKMGVSYVATESGDIPNISFGAGGSTSKNYPSPSHASTTTGHYKSTKTLVKASTWKQKGGRNRKEEILIDIHLSKVRCSHETYPQHSDKVSRQVLLIHDLEIRDRLLISNINKFLYYPRTNEIIRSATVQPKPMIEMETIHLRPHQQPPLTAQECNLRIAIQELRINIDQDTLLFLITFFNEIGQINTDLMNNNNNQMNTNNPDNNSGHNHNTSGGSSNLNSTQQNDSTSMSSSTSSLSTGGGSSRLYNTPTHHHPPVMMVEDMLQATQDYHARKMVSENLLILMEENTRTKDDDDDGGGGENVSSSSAVGPELYDNLPIFFKNIEFSPAVPIRLDYEGKRIELTHGPLAGLLMGLGQLNCSELRLKKIVHRNGILGIDRLLNFLLQEWLQDIKKNQLPSILGGIGPMHTFLQLFKGIVDLFWLPIEQYQKDGRIVHGLQLGAKSFTACTVLAALELTTRLIHLLQITAETAYDMVSPGPSLRRTRGYRKGKRKRIQPPQDIREGVSNAYQIVKEGVGDAAHTLVEVAALEHDQKGYTGSVGAVIRQIPPNVIRPIVLATQATTNVLGGIKNQFIPDARREAREKWKDDDD